MAEYDSILKEKKKYEEPVPTNTGPKPFPWFKIDLLLIILLLIISYTIYYTTILAPEQIFLTDLKTIFDKYQKILTPLKIEELDNNYNLEGIITLNEQKYNYGIIKNENNMNLSLSLNDKTLNYYLQNNNSYLKLSSLEDQYLKLTANNYSDLLNNTKDYFTNNLSRDKFIKKFYFNGTTPIVESNLILNSEDLKTILNPTNEADSYEVLFTFKNHSITNEIISMKITINNLITTERGVILYENGYLTYKDDTKNLKFQLEEKNKDFTLKIYQNDTLYSVLTGTKQGTSYQYMYQIIDEIYNLTLNVKQENNLYSYQLTSNIEKENNINKQELNITMQIKDDIILENTELSIAKNYELLTEEEKELYQNGVEEIVGDLRQFIKEHQ